MREIHQSKSHTCSFAVLSPENSLQPITGVGSSKQETALRRDVKYFSGFVPSVLPPFKISNVGGRARYESIR